MVLFSLLASCSAIAPDAHESTTLAAAAESSISSSAYVSTFTVLDTHPHCATTPCTAFTEGLAFDGAGNLFESNGGYEGDALRGLRRVDLATGASVGNTIPPREGQFVEGLTVLPDGRSLQLTYREGQVNEYHTQPALEHVRTVDVTLGNEGWGLAHSADGSVLYVTDSTERLLTVNASTLEVMRTVDVFDQRLGRAVYGVNELELVGDELWGNVYPTCKGSAGQRVLCDHSECIARIDPATGLVRGWVDFTTLPARESDAVRADAMDNVFNGIAYHAPSDRLLVTGKNWGSIYRVALAPTTLDEKHVESVCRLAV